MTDPVRLPHSDAEEPQAEAAAYAHGELTPEERAAFEAHLPTCEACRAAVETERKLAPVVAAVLADPPVKTAEEYLAMMDAAEAKLEASSKAKATNRAWPERRRWAPYWPWLVASAAAAAVAVTVALPSTPVAELAFIGKPPGRIELAPAPPGVPIPPSPVALPVSARMERPSVAFWKHPTLVIEAPREPKDHFVEVALLDANGKFWEVGPTEAAVSACGNACGPLSLRVDLAAFPPGKATVMVLVGPDPADERRLWRDAYEVAIGTPVGVGERAAGKAEITW